MLDRLFLGKNVVIKGMGAKGRATIKNAADSMVAFRNPYFTAIVSTPCARSPSISIIPFNTSLPNPKINTMVTKAVIENIASELETPITNIARIMDAGYERLTAIFPKNPYFFNQVL